ncbi:tripartite tricarboxylate transporter TctB family protein [uncultured Jannaschia sp.]|uniref:tripartite tricarboxylate transporter TctB family protein n=1 Tax=uncultured Jannaschia sp. TaxID=293347 RepID=UPI00260F5F83|nr:tripartite tricarboxylate transporter TctB family protein [uncultured Jannaschia sp.]
MIDWKSQDAVSGLMFLAVAIYGGVSTLMGLDIGSLDQMGPGFFPLALSVILGVIGVFVLLGARPDEDQLAPVNWRAISLIGAAPVAFGLTVRSLGLLPALLISVALATLSSSRIRPIYAAFVIIGVTAFCIAVFKYGIRVPYDLINRRLLP